MNRLSCVLVTIIGIAACGPSDKDFSEFASYPSPRGSLTVIVAAAHSRLSFGSETIRIYVNPAGGRAKNHVLTTKISNDGGGITNDNIQIEWLGEDRIQFCLSGDEQQDTLIEINLLNLQFSEKLQPCHKMIELES